MLKPLESFYRQIKSKYSKLKLTIFLLTVWMLLPYALLDGGTIHADNHIRHYSDRPIIDEPSNNENDRVASAGHTAWQDARMDELEREIDESNVKINGNATRIEDLQRDVWIWKGAVLGIGGLITILELLQALGFARSGRGAQRFPMEKMEG